MPKEVICPVCDASVPLEARDKEGDFVYCGFCSAQLRLHYDYNEDETAKFKAVEEYD